MANLEPNAQAPLAGMNQDVDPVNQPQGTYRFALNAQLQDIDGNFGNISSELGNEVLGSLPEGKKPIGHVQTDTEDLVLFLYDEDGDHEIGIFSPHAKTYTSYIVASCLNFDDRHPVDALFRIAKGCNRTIYFTDTINYYRVVDLDDLEAYKDDDGNWECSRMRFKRQAQLPRLTPSAVFNAGGSLKIGAYQYSIRYLDDDLNATDWLFITNHINIYDDSTNAPYVTIDGGVNAVETTDEEGAVAPTNKSVELQIDNLDQSFKYFQIAAIVSLEATGFASTAYILPRQAITQESQTYIHSTNSGEGITQTTVLDIQTQSPNIDIIQTHAQTDNTLFIAGIKEDVRDWAAYQKAANDITVK